MSSTSATVPSIVDVRTRPEHRRRAAAAAAVTVGRRPSCPCTSPATGRPRPAARARRAGVEDAAHAHRESPTATQGTTCSAHDAPSLYATKNVAVARAAWSADDDAVDRDAAAEASVYGAPRRGLALRRHRAPASRRTSPTSSPAIALVQLDKIEEHAATRRRHVAAYDVAVAELAGNPAAGARPARPPRAPPLRRPDRSPRAPARTATRTSAPCAEEEHRDEHPLPPVTGSAYCREALPRPAAPAGGRARRRRGAARCRSRRRTRTPTSRTRSTRSAASTPASPGASRRAPPPGQARRPAPRLRRGDRVPALVDRPASRPSTSSGTATGATCCSPSSSSSGRPG